MKKGEVLRIGEIVRVQQGRFKGIVGTVTGIDRDTAEVFCEGVFDGQVYRDTLAVKLAALGRNHG